MGVPVLGIEPAKKTAEAAIQKGIPTEMGYFTARYAQLLKGSGKQADLIIGNNVLAHNPLIVDFVNGMAIALKPKGIITIEFPHVLAMLNNNEFDTIYHEHYSYLGCKTVQRLFEDAGLTLFDVDEIPTHGGSLRLYAQHTATGKFPVSPNVQNLIDKEKQEGLFLVQTYSGFTAKIEKVKRDLLAFLIEQKNAGKHLAGYGAPAKGNTLLNYCGIRTDFIDYTVDRSPLKQNYYLPGTHIPIYDPKKIQETKPDFVFILPWNIKSEIMEQMSMIREWGGKFFTAIPHLEMYG
jgi:SAM-dependent methyltransferase